MQIYYDFTGFIHFVAACMALVAGTTVLALYKGNRLHKVFGYVYALSMTIVFITSFMIYRLFDGFGIFHVFALIGILTLLAGMLPMFLFKKTPKIISIHMSFMYWSVMGLYGAFISETVVRLKLISFYNMLGISVAFVMGVAAYFFIKYKPKWEKIYT